MEELRFYFTAYRFVEPTMAYQTSLSAGCVVDGYVHFLSCIRTYFYTAVVVVHSQALYIHS